MIRVEFHRTYGTERIFGDVFVIKFKYNITSLENQRA